MSEQKTNTKRQTNEKHKKKHRARNTVRYLSNETQKKKTLIFISYRFTQMLSCTSPPTSPSWTERKGLRISAVHLGKIRFAGVFFFCFIFFNSFLLKPMLIPRPYRSLFTGKTRDVFPVRPIKKQGSTLLVRTEVGNVMQMQWVIFCFLILFWFLLVYSRNSTVDSVSRDAQFDIAILVVVHNLSCYCVFSWQKDIVFKF